MGVGLLIELRMVQGQVTGPHESALAALLFKQLLTFVLVLPTRKAFRAMHKIIAAILLINQVMALISKDPL